jgi:hypothetical protein
MRLLRRLPPRIQDLAEEGFRVFEKNPNDPLLETQSLYDSDVGRHRKGSYSTRVSYRYRAIYVIDNGKNGDQERQYCWYWIGTREDYANFIGSR